MKSESGILAAFAVMLGLIIGILWSIDHHLMVIGHMLGAK